MADLVLRDERKLEEAEETLKDWATALAIADRAYDAAAALKMADALLCFRLDFMGSEKRP